MHKIRVYKGIGGWHLIDQFDTSDYDKAEQAFNEFVCAYARSNKEEKFTIDWNVGIGLYKRVQLHKIHRKEVKL